MRRLRRALSAMAVGTLFLAGCEPMPSPGTLPFPPVPAPRTEVVPKPPPSYDSVVWQPGHWEWAGNGYEWHNGAWTLQGNHSTRWQDGFWAKIDDKFVWQPGHWM